MTNQKRLTKKQLSVLDDLFSSDMSAEQVLQKHNVTTPVFNKWQADETFAAEYDSRIASLYRQSEFIIAKYAGLAAAKLVQLTESKSAETARKACLDIIQLPKLLTKKQPAPAEADSEKQTQQLSPETAGRILTALAEQ